MAVRRWRIYTVCAVLMIAALHYLTEYRRTPIVPIDKPPQPAKAQPKNGRTHWSKHPDQYPVKSFIPLPTGRPKKIPLVQTTQPAENATQKTERLKRKAAVKESFQHSWEGYKKKAWLRDEVAPISAGYKDTFGGWAATLVDSLDTLWILGMKEDFELAVAACNEIDFTTTETQEINVFETTIRYMGGFLAAYDISGARYTTLLEKAVEVGDLLMGCFDTPNRMPIPRWDWQKYTQKVAQTAPKRILVSELGSLSLEFTRLSQLTGDPKYYDAVQRISDELEKGQSTTKLPGMWPVSVDAETPSFNEDTFFSLGGMSDSLYEYFPKQYLILGGLLSQPKKLYEGFIEVAKKHMFFRAMNPNDEAILVSGDIRAKSSSQFDLDPRGQHLTCFTGGMVGLASRIFDRPDDLEVAAQLTAGCVWAYDASANGIAPEIYSVLPCPRDGSSCTWSQQAYHDALATLYSQSESPDRESQIQKLISARRLPAGFTAIDDRRYILRPEAIESVFLMWRITGESKWQDAAWRMFQRVERVSRTPIAAAAVADITVDPQAIGGQLVDSMESFWLAETLKYFYLCFEDFGVVSLDEFVLNTEAHPLRRPGK